MSALLSIVEHDDVGTDFVSTDGTDGSGPGDDDPVAMVVTALEELCAMYQVSLEDVADFLPGYVEFLDVAVPEAPAEPAKPALTVIDGGKAR